jgi:hypothetical protein
MSRKVVRSLMVVGLDTYIGGSEIVVKGLMYSTRSVLERPVARGDDAIIEI